MKNVYKNINDLMPVSFFKQKEANVRKILQK